MERNVDKIKRLEFDLANKTREAAKLRAERDKHDKGIGDLSHLVDALIVNCAVQFGQETETGYILTLPKFDMAHCLEAFLLKVRGQNEDGTEYIFEAVEIAKLTEVAVGIYKEPEAQT